MFPALTVEQLSSFPSSHSVLALEDFLALAEASCGHIEEVFIPFLSALLSRIYKPREFKHEVAQAGAGAKGGDRREDGLLQVVTIQNAIGTNFRSENGGNSNRSIFNSKVSNIVLKVLCFYTDKVAGAVVCLY